MKKYAIKTKIIPKIREAISGGFDEFRLIIISGKNRKVNPKNNSYIPKINTERAALLISLNNLNFTILFYLIKKIGLQNCKESLIFKRA